MKTGSIFSLFRALRPKQWTKNIVVAAAFIFALGDQQQKVSLAGFWSMLEGMLLFCIVSSGIYLLNDIRDLPFDRMHPTKKLRPIAAGEISPVTAGILACVLLVAGLAFSWLLNPKFFAVVLAYIVLQLTYTFVLKNVALVDSITIATGFALRALAGAVVILVPISPWLMLCAFLLALFLALCKRRHEKVILESVAADTRAVLGRYDERLLDQLIAVISSATLVSYALYTLWPDTVNKFGSNHLALTIPFVVFGLFRYLDLVYRHEKGDRPEQILLTDLPLMINLILYGIAVFLILKPF